MAFGGVQARWAEQRNRVNMPFFITILIWILVIMILQHIKREIIFRGCQGKVGRTPKSS